MKTTSATFVLLIQTLQCLASDDSPFELTNKATGFCLVKTNNCFDIRWTTSDRLLVPQRKKCLGVQGKSVGSEINLYDCDENSALQKWECRNETVLALKDQELYIELTADNTAVLSKTIGRNNHLTISGTSNGACSRTYRELYAIGGNAAGMLCMFPFKYKQQWYSDCTTVDSENMLWCAVETEYQSERWGYCPDTTRRGWNIHPTTGAYYQLNTQSAVTWSQAETSCKQQGASLLSITDPHEQAYVTAILGIVGNKLWTGLILDSAGCWKWSDGRPYRYLKWDSGHPIANAGHNCAIVEPSVQYSWQSLLCSRKLGYICYSRPEAARELPTQAVETGFCSRPWIPYNGHCFYLNRTQKTWSDAQRDCRNGGGDLVSIRNVEDHSFVISQLGYTSTDELWIGLNDRKTEGLFEWIDHSTVSFTSWESGEPAAFNEVEDCVLIKGENGNWVDRVCEQKHGFICMKMSTSNPTGEAVEQNEGCKTGWRRHGSYCYFIGTKTKSFDQARDDCKSSDSYLADVSNGVDNAFLVSLVGMRPERYFWLGLSNQKNIDEFVWTNSDSVRFTHWNAEMPGHQQGCVALTTGIFAGLWNVLPCTNKEKYICKHLAEGAVATTAPPIFTPAKCSEGWTRMGSRKYCAKLFPDRRSSFTDRRSSFTDRRSSFTDRRSSNERTWYEARDYCKAIGGDLLSIHSAAEQEELSKHRFGNVWIGLSAPDPATGYVWSDGSPLQFQHWDLGEPNNKNNVESCTLLIIHHIDSSGSWRDVHCELNSGWLCQIPTGVTPNPPPDPVTPNFNTTLDGWLEWDGNQYYINRRNMAMEEARNFCKKRHSDLVTINSEAENVFLWKRIYRDGTGGDYWIGLTVDLDNTYEWMDGSPVVFQRWDENQPRFLNNDENCAVMTSSMGFWHDFNCGYEYNSICKRSGPPLPGATVAPTVLPRGGCPQNWKKFDLKCYNIINSQNETWEGARTQCKAMGGNLASILSGRVQVFLTSQMSEAPTTNLWIGLHSSNRQSSQWTDGRPVRFRNWGNYQWNGHSHFSRYVQEDCVVMTTDPNIGIGKWIKRSCNDTTGYICLRNVDPSLQDSPEPTTMDYVQIFNDSFKIVTQRMTWTAAKKHCERDGAKLASLRNAWSQAYTELMTLELKGQLWIGLNTLETRGNFRYVDGTRITFTNWDQGEPRMGRPCVIVTENGKWRTSECDQNMASICMKSTDVPPTESSVFPGFCPDNPETSRFQTQTQTASWISFKGYCYLFVTARVKWPDATAYCVTNGGHLASIADPSEQEFIQSNIKIYEDSLTSFWIGLYRTHRGILMWLDKTVMDYTNWRTDELHNYNFGYISASDGGWGIQGQWDSKAYICKTPKVTRQVPPTAVIPTVDLQTRSHLIWAVALVITVIAIATVILFFLKKSGYSFPIREKPSTFGNPLFFNNEQSQPDVVD